ncbi:MAG: apolipoprotein N-acyltransferase [Spirochaetota bacterium]
MDNGTIRLSTREIVIAAFITGIATSLAFPMKNIFWIAYASVIPMAIIVYTSSLKKILLGFAVFAVTFFGILLFWVASYMLKETPLWVAILSFIIILAILWMYYALTAVIASYFGKRMPYARAFIFAASFTTLEYLRTVGFLGFPWGILGYSQFMNLPFIQIADVTGVFGISFALYFCNGVIADVIIRFRAGEFDAGTPARPVIIEAAALIALLAGMFTYGAVTLGRSSGDAALRTERVALVQENYDFNYRWTGRYTTEPAKGSFFFMDTKKIKNNDAVNGKAQNGTVVAERLAKLAVEAARAQPSLIVFSESATLDYYEHFLPEVEKFKNTPNGVKTMEAFAENGYASYLNVYRLYQGVNASKCEWLLGTPLARRRTNSDKMDFYNGALLLSTNGAIVERYAKRRMVPFGEAYPFYDSPLKNIPPFSFLIGFMYDQLEKAGAGNWTPWHEATVFTHPKKGYRFSASICFEDAFGDSIREFVRRGAQVLFNISNDAWSYSDSSEWQHFAISVFRAIENRRDMLRATNCGVTGHVDAYGRIKRTFPLWTAGQMIADFTVRTGMTIYTHIGDVFAGLIALVLFILIAVNTIRTIVEARVRE